MMTAPKRIKATNTTAGDKFNSRQSVMEIHSHIPMSMTPKPDIDTKLSMLKGGAVKLPELIAGAAVAAAAAVWVNREPMFVVVAGRRPKEVNRSGRRKADERGGLCHREKETERRRRGRADYTGQQDHRGHDA
jgi:hypothetical protein